MKLVLTLLTRDQADVIDAVVAFHLHAGVDFVIATDHRSGDGTTEILESYERDGVLRLIREEGEELQTRAWRTRMARLAAEDHGADWVIGCDGDEFWWPRRGSLKDVLSAVPQAFGVVEAPWRFFPPMLGGPPFFADRMIVRLSPAAALVHPYSPFKPGVKIAHRADPRLVVQGGGHRLLSDRFVMLPGWHPIEVLHFPVRDLEQQRRRHEQWQGAGRNWKFMRGSIVSARQFFDSVAVDQKALTIGLERGSLTLDTRLRDALRTLRLSDGYVDQAERQFVLPRERATLVLPRPTIDEDRAYAADLQSLAESSLVPLQRRLDELEKRISTCEGGSR